MLVGRHKENLEEKSCIKWNCLTQQVTDPTGTDINTKMVLSVRSR
jgi:hypothetical protein